MDQISTRFALALRLLTDVLEGRVAPRRVFDRTVTLDEVPDGYRAMDSRQSIKVMVTLWASRRPARRAA
jgi:threonine dehydrogenase-like Zn-dependent dehydrogenase